MLRPLCFVYLFRDSILLSCPGWLQFVILLPQLPEYQNCRQVQCVPNHISKERTEKALHLCLVTVYTGTPITITFNC